MNQLLLAGCRTQPLASYLKALGLFRVLSLQHSSKPRLGWSQGQACLETSLSHNELIEWILEHYAPTPVTSPWNGGSGYYPNDKSANIALKKLEQSPHPRFDGYRVTFQDCRRALEYLKLTEKPEPKQQKPQLIRRLRSSLRHAQALEWLDAACVLSHEEDRVEMVPLLGTGGNDGRLDFSSAFMQNLVELLLADKKAQPQIRALLNQSLFDVACKGLSKNPVGQFAPGQAGGPNTTSGFDGSPNLNPWDFVLMVEGALVFSAAATRRLTDSTQGYSLPFTVDVSLAGHSAISPDEKDSARCEMWLPIWCQPIDFQELRMVFSEGRAQVGRRQATSGIDFARAVASLGVERGLEGFERFTFLVRNGKSYFASPTGYYRVEVTAHDRRRAVDCLQELDPWMLRYRARAEGNSGAALRSYFRSLDDAILGLCQGNAHSERENLLPILILLGKIQRQLARTPKIQDRKELSFVEPLGGLSSAWWPQPSEDDIELRLALSFVGLKGIKTNLLPIKGREWDNNSRDAVWTRAPLEQNIVNCLARRFISRPLQGDKEILGEELQAWRFRWDRWKDKTLLQPPTQLRDLQRFLSRQTSDTLIEDLIYGLSLISGESPSDLDIRSDSALVPLDYCILKTVFRVPERRSVGQGAVWLAPGDLLQQVAAGQTDLAMRRSLSFLRSRGAPPAMELSEFSSDPVRLAASIAFPISTSISQRIARRALKQEEEK
jgi:CRISPR-associated protein Csx17